MQPITIGRFSDDPTAQGVIRPADDTWQLVIDKDGYPHLYIRCPLDPADCDGATSGMLCIEDLFPEGMDDIPTLMKSTFGGKCSPEEEEAAHAEHIAKIEASGRPCPRP